ncbi:hypothetical protein [Nonomuraea typhae]|uniref:Uncharacterized protein n=1 Tax=Nonomuraea typhae TaxID=2603600 RepID=A0ABW7Z903_9ACTN
MKWGLPLLVLVCVVGGPEVNRGRLYLLAGHRARHLATGWNAFPAAGDSGFWITDQPSYGGPCTVRKQSADGELLRRPRWTYCGALPFADTPYGLHARHARTSILLTHDSLRKTAAYPHIVAATAENLLVVRPGRKLALMPSGRPGGHPGAAGGIKDGEASPGGRYVAVPFLTPTPAAHELLDVRVLDTKTLAWTRLPAMPMPVDVKTRRMRWLPDGRLVLAGAFVTTADPYPPDSAYAAMIAVWRPGEQALSRIRLPVDWQSELTILGPPR